MRALLAVLALAALACATLSAPPASPGAGILRAKCGACHLRPEPGRFAREGWERVLDTHARRVPLDDEQRAQLLDHLAPGTAESPDRTGDPS